MAKLRPLYDHVVIERSEAEERTPGGIVLPDTAKDKPKQGTVVSVGTGRRLEDGRTVALDLRAGDKVLFGAYSGNEVKVDGKDYLILKEAEVLAVVEGGK